ncbi:MAG: hypothetical protein ACXWUG_07310 [Polyangiales bacterium]
MDILCRPYEEAMEMLERRWVKARVVWKCPACGVRNDLRADDALAAPTCPACHTKLDAGSAEKRDVLELLALSAFSAGGSTGHFGAYEVECHPFSPTCSTCTALLDTRWASSGGCALRCAPCGREHVSAPVPRTEHDDLRAMGANPRDPSEIWACFEGDGALANSLQEAARAEASEPSAVLWPLLWLGVIAFASAALIVARLLW